jgi:outer membrane protein assembly factor BamB
MEKLGRISKTVLLALTLTTVTLMAGMPSANAVVEVKTYAYLSINPNPIALGEYTVINVWLQPIPPTAADVFHGFMVTITKPDGSKETRGPLNSSAIGSQYFVFTPDMVGSYTFKFSYPGEYFAQGTIRYLPSESPNSTLVVQKEPVPSWQENPLPTDFWERPINARNREWWQISGNWLIRGYNTSYVQGASDSGKGFNPYSQAPRSPHVMWTKELALGGLIGGEYGTAPFYSGLTYEAKLTPPIIMDGKMYYRIYPSDFGYYQGVALSWPGAVCVNLRTGEELWRNTDMRLDAGQIYNFISANQMGGIPYLWDLATYGPFSVFADPSVMFRPHEWHLYDGNTGALIATFRNAMSVNFVTGGTVVYGHDGTMYVYFLNGRAGWLAMWNSTKAFAAANFIPDIPGSEVPFLRNIPGTYDWRTGIQWNVTIPIHVVQDVPSPPLNPTGMLFPAAQGVTGNVLIAAVESRSRSYMELGYSLITGKELWNHNLTIDQYTAARAYGEGVYAGFNPNQRVWFGYDANTGQQLWISDPADYPWGTYGLSGVIAYGKLYALSYDGSVHAFDIKTGKQVFKYYSGDDLFRETPYGHFPFYYGPIIADGVVFAGNGEHSPSIPLYRGYKLHAFDAKTGDPIWNISGWMAIQAIADGYLVAYNAEDNCIYVFGKGPSATIVSASSDVIPKGSSVLIKGTVIDQSPGQPGTPCVAKESMSGWMEYLHMQQPIPAEVTGVPVDLYATYPNGTTFYIGTATTDPFAGGVYGLAWSPPEEGTYTLIAVFKGDESYGSSSAGTVIHVTAAPPESATAEQAEATQSAIEALQPWNMILTVLVIIAIVIGIVNLYALRRRK